MSDTLKFAKKYLEVSRLDQFIDPDELGTVTMEPVPEDIKPLIEDSIRPQECYRNVASVMSFFGPAARYCIVLAPMEHCVLEVDGKYYDPTWELRGLNPLVEDYVPLVYLNRDELYDLLTKNDYVAPDLNDIHRKWVSEERSV